MAVALILQQVHIKSLKKHRDEQAFVIASQTETITNLLERKTYNFEVKINVTDKSKVKVNNKWNKGTVNTSGDKSYSIDSVSFSRIIDTIIESENKRVNGIPINTHNKK
jgi:hypothetical protein